MDPQVKKKVLRQISYGLYVIGLKAGEELHAFTGSWFSQSSLNPPMVMLGVRKDSKSFEMIQKGRVFTVNFVGKEDRKILEHFFKPVPRNGNRLGDFAFKIGKTGAPILEAAVSFLECEVREMAGNGDHAVMIAEVVEAGIHKEAPPLTMSDTPWHYGG